MPPFSPHLASPGAVFPPRRTLIVLFRAAGMGVGGGRRRPYSKNLNSFKEPGAEMVAPRLARWPSELP